MKSFKWIGLLAVAGCFFVGGCDSGGVRETAPVAEQNELEAYVTAHPDSGAGLEPEGGSVDAPATGSEAAP